MPQMMPIYWVIMMYSSMFIFMMLLDLFYYQENKMFMMEGDYIYVKSMYKW